MSNARWGIGALELDRSNEAMPGEMMVDSKTGLFAVKSYNGTRGNNDNVYSYDYNTRLKNTINEFKQYLNSIGHVSNVVKIDISDNIGPFILENNVGYDLSSKTIVTGKQNFVHVNFDIDLVNKKTGIIANDTINIGFSFIFAHDKIANTDHVYSYTMTPEEANMFTMKPNYNSGFENVTNCTYDVKLGGIIVSVPDSVATNNNIILNSILFAYC